MAETFEQILARIYPPEIDGGKRPKEPIPSDLPFSVNHPQLIENDDEWYEHENTMMRRSMSNDRVLNELINAIQGQLASCDLRLVTQALKGLMSPADKTKLDGMQAGATNYVHPATHPATMITPDATHRFTTDAEKTTWNGKANASHGTHIPAPQGANNGIFLRNDNTWQYVTPGNIGAYTKAETYTKTEANNLLNAKAPLANPGLTGTPTAPTAATATNNTQIATTAFVKAAITSGGGGIVGGSLAQNGWVKFANGLILQWGAEATFHDISSISDPSCPHETNFLFPISFPSKCLRVVPSIYSINTPYGVGYIKNPTLRGFTMRWGEWNSHAQDFNGGFVAIGC